MTETPEGEIIRKIREAERHVEEDLKRAEAEAGLLIETARTEAVRELSRSREIASGEEARAREEAARGAGEAAAEEVARAEAEASAFRDRARSLIPDLASRLADRILPPISPGSSFHLSPGKKR